MPLKRNINIALFFLLLASALTRGWIAGMIELGNDEVYYWTYAKFPALSHFDHPPMVGLVIQFFTMNLAFDGEFFIRLAAVVLGTLSTWLMFLIGRRIHGPLAGLYAAMLFTASFYGFVLAGTFILPDAPQVFFWLLTLFLYLEALPDRKQSLRSRKILILAGITGGMAILSKYHSLFLLAGALCYMLVYNRNWLKTKALYISILLFASLCLPVLFWNLQNDFISFTYHENRVGITGSGFQPKYFLTEILGQFFYNNPVNVILIVVAVAALSRKNVTLAGDYKRIILWVSLPLLIVFTSFSLFRSTLPHWTGPGYLGLLLIAAVYLAEVQKKWSKPRLVPNPVIAALLFSGVVLALAIGQIRYGMVNFQKFNARDISADMAGWKELERKFAPVAALDEQTGTMPKGAPILSFRWFPAANMDYYISRMTGNPVYALGSLERIHKYHWINQIKGGLKQGTSAYYIALSDDYQDPAGLYGAMFDSILPPDTLQITRNHDTIRQAYIYRLKYLKHNLTFPQPGLNE